MSWLQLFGAKRSTEGGIVPGVPCPLADCGDQPESQARQIARSLRDFPEDWAWQHKGYELKHVPSGFVMWVANEDYGLAEVIDGSGRKEKFSKNEQSTIWPAVQAWLAQFKTSFSLKPAKPRVRFTGLYWYCHGDGHPWVGVGDTSEEAYQSWVRAVSVQARKEIRPTEYLHVWSAAV